MKTKSALAYFGSDSEVADQLAAMFDDCKHVTIPFVGGASIIPYLKARAIVANDLNDLAINFYRVMSGMYGVDERDDLITRCQHTLSHASELDEALRLLRSGTAHPIGRAWAYWAMCWIGRKGKGGTKCPATMPSVRWTATGGTNASRIRAAASDLAEWSRQFERCEWLSICFRELLPKVSDARGCGLYVDAPWVDAGDAYLHPFSEDDHRDLESKLRRFTDTLVVVRYGDKPLIRELYRGWTIIEAESRDQCNAVKGELWITNRGF